MGTIQHCNEWKDLAINDETFNQCLIQYKWDVTWAVLKQVKHFCYSTLKQNSLWCFIIKHLHNQLPVRH
ncbi:hypothetical protein RclHR1_25310003 [Rhizophagus clarus]|uniref:Uncharacterized protein n=1 Tax=Rhizophagus clarus TaxID=94130 RepID=A0A2Z6RES9_9GLOM|nr:hypothetical protein RclHR1_25310003 [Rhizophagus clarus]